MTVSLLLPTTGCPSSPPPAFYFSGCPTPATLFRQLLSRPLKDPVPPPPLHKAYSVSNIKTHVPLQLNLDQLNHNIWAEILSNHCKGFDVVDHIDETYDTTEALLDNHLPTEPEWIKHESIVKSWIYGTITPSLIQNIFQRNLIALQAWLNLRDLFQVNKEANAMQLDNELRNMTIGTMSIHDYCTKIKKIGDLLANIESPIPDKNLVTYTSLASPVVGRAWSFVSGNLSHHRRKIAPSFLARNLVYNLYK